MISALTLSWAGVVMANSDASDRAAVPLFGIPKALREIEADMKRLESELAELPELQETLQFDAYGYHGGYKPALEELPAEPRWTVDVEFRDYAQVQKITLVPAVDRRFERLRSYGFPERFRVLSVFPDGSTRVVREWMDEDCPDPGRLPLRLFVPPPRSHVIRIEVFRGAEEVGNELFALDELYGALANDVERAVVVRVNGEYEALPYWSKAFLIDHKTGLGLPVGAAASEAADSRLPDFAVVFDAQSEPECVVELDLGQNLNQGWVALFPASPPEGTLTPGYGFPRSIRLEVVEEREDGSRKRPYHDRRAFHLGDPGNNLVRIAGFRRVGRWLRLVCRDLPVYAGRPTFGLGEIHVYRRGESCPVKSVRLEGFPPGSVDEAALIHDGMAAGRPIMFLADWLKEVEQRSLLDAELDELKLMRQDLDARWERFWSVAVGTVAFLLAAAGIGVALITVVQRRRGLDGLRNRIARDLHDEVGSNLGSISLSADRLIEDVGDDRLKEDLADLGLLAREASASLLDVIWVTDQSVIRLPALMEKLMERASRVLSGMDLSVTVSPDCPDRAVPLTFKRHLVMFFKEAIHNCARHSQATRVEIGASVADEGLKLRVHDNGIGFDPAAARDGWGIDSMKERAQELGGRMDLHSCPGEGSTIELTIPLSALSKRTDHQYRTSN